MGGGRAEWHMVFLSYPCPTCGAQPREECATVSGRWAFPHVARTRQANRCPRCGVVVPAEEPGALCGRCALVRALEVERSTRWVRRDPD